MLRRYQLDELSAIIDRKCNGDGIRESGIPGVRALRVSDRGIPYVSVCAPSIFVMAQGLRQITIGRETHHYRPMECLGVCVDMPVRGMVLEATRDKPCLALQIDLDLNQISELFAQMPRTPDIEMHARRGLFVSHMDANLIDATLRIARLFNTPADIPALGPLAVREFYYRLLQGNHGPAIIELALRGSHMQRMANVITFMKNNIAKSVSVDELAYRTQMKPSSFHAHFKRITAMSPLQYQKAMRLIFARNFMLSENLDAVSAAKRVGYESPSQFSREYARMFGAPPIRDLKRAAGK